MTSASEVDEPAKEPEPPEDQDEVDKPKPSGLAHGMRALRYPNFRKFWLGALISNTGTWLQNLAIPFVLLEITNRATWAGIAAFSALFPAMLLAPLAGNLADRFNRRTVLLIGQSAAACVALLLWGIWVAGVREPAAIVAVATLGGVIQGFMIPFWQSFIPLLVPVEALPSAVSLNSLQFNTARAIGPALGGVFIALAGASWAFLLNALSFGAVLVALAMANPSQRKQATVQRSVRKGFVESVAYIKTQPGIMMGIGLATIVAVLGYPIVTFVVVFAKQVYEVDASMVGFLSALIGIGSILAVPVVSGVFGDIERASMIRFAVPLYGVSILIFGSSWTTAQGALGLLMSGAAFMAIVVTSNTAVQSIVSERIRGRVIATRIMFFTGGYPLGALLQTRLSDATSPRVVVSGAGITVIAIGLFLTTKPHWLRRLDDPPDLSDEMADDVDEEPDVDPAGPAGRAAPKPATG